MLLCEGVYYESDEGNRLRNDETGDLCWVNRHLIAMHHIRVGDAVSGTGILEDGDRYLTKVRSINQVTVMPPAIRPRSLADVIGEEATTRIIPSTIRSNLWGEATQFTYSSAPRMVDLDEEDAADETPVEWLVISDEAEDEEPRLDNSDLTVF